MKSVKKTTTVYIVERLEKGYFLSCMASSCPFDSVSPNEGEVILAEVFQILLDVSIKPITNPYILSPNRGTMQSFPHQ